MIGNDCQMSDPTTNPCGFALTSAFLVAWTYASPCGEAGGVAEHGQVGTEFSEEVVGGVSCQ